MKRQESKAPARSNGKQDAAPSVEPRKSAPLAAAAPTLDDVRRRAYEIFLGRQSTGSPGTAESDWKQAERELSKH